MKLADLFSGQSVALPLDAASVEISSLAVDSRRVTPGALFAALPGALADGADFAGQAARAGAAAILSPRKLDLPVPCVIAPEPRAAFARAAARFHGNPSSRFNLLGVTGTNGKTTTTYLVEQLATALEQRAGVIGTVETRWPGNSRPSTHTTPESHELQALLAEMARAPIDVAAIEVSSHALAQDRVTGCRFAGAAFTNLTRDHLDYHGTLEAYFDAKARLFRELLPGSALSVINLDDPRCARLAAELLESERPVLGFTVRGARAPRGAMLLAAENLDCTLEGLSFNARLERPEQRAGAPDAEASRIPVTSPLLGAHNAENLLAAMGLLIGTGAHLPMLARVAGQAHGAPGRLQRIPDPCERVVLVDYAHSDDALARVLDAIAFAAGTEPRIVCVFGCGGDRDQGKRPLMGKAAGARAHLTIATSDNPRTEDPLAIMNDALVGIRRVDVPHVVEPDRQAAIRRALKEAREGDIVILAGKGHETYQVLKDKTIDFDDRAVAREVLKGYGYHKTQ